MLTYRLVGECKGMMTDLTDKFAQVTHAIKSLGIVFTVVQLLMLVLTCNGKVCACAQKILCSFYFFLLKIILFSLKRIYDIQSNFNGLNSDSSFT